MHARVFVYLFEEKKMSAVSEFPTTLSKYQKDFPYATQEEMIQIVTTVAKKTSHLYARLLTLEGHTERDNTLAFSVYPWSFPSKETVDLFEICLAEKIIENLLSKLPSQHSSFPLQIISLTTDYRPEKCLLDTLESCKISHNTCPDLHRYFPCKTHTDIRLDRDLQIIQITMRP
jgi:hypothetical protein